MKLSRLDSMPFEPVSHDPRLRKKVLLRDPLPGMKHISHIILRPGERVTVHSHPDAYEVFYCIRGEARMKVGEEEISLLNGTCLVVEPGEEHAFVEIIDEVELLYFLCTAGA